ncbi:hypothetical protein M2169_005170 [Streptomyces sp. MJP52]|nr:hypothetical protein [Streptomyces sp. MJP52]
MALSPLARLGRTLPARRDAPPAAGRRGGGQPGGGAV